MENWVQATKEKTKTEKHVCVLTGSRRHVYCIAYVLARGSVVIVVASSAPNCYIYVCSD